MTRPHSAAKRAARWPWIWMAMFVLAVLMAATFFTLYARTSRALDGARNAAAAARAAASAAQKTADCVNVSLRQRDALTGQLHDADELRVRGQKDAETVKAHALGELSRAATPEDAASAIRLYIAGENAFQRTLTDYLRTSNRIRGEQLRHPLGRC